MKKIRFLLKRDFSVQGTSVFYSKALEVDGKCPVIQKFDKKDKYLERN